MRDEVMPLSGKALQDSERRFRLLVEGVVDYAIYMLDPSGIITNWNSGAERIKGYSAEEAVGKHFSIFYELADREANRPARALETALREGKFEAKSWRLRKDGTRFMAQVVIDPLYDQGELIGFAKITRDISERREAQIKLDKLQKQLAESQKMDALGHLTGGVAHDFNNLLMIVSGNIEILKRNAIDARSIRAANAIELAAQRGASLTRQLLTFSRRQALKPEPVHLPQRVQAIRDVLVSGAGRADIKITSPEETWPVIVDTAELEIALVNLVVNARDALPKGGTIEIQTTNTELDGKDYVAICVIDNGEGIPPDVLEKVFDPFFTTKPVGKGTGLGLSQVHGFVHQAGGTIKVETKLGDGTTVKLYLPRAVHPALSQSENDEGFAPHRNGTVLLVEDNPDVAVATCSLLEELGYSVRWASSAAAALEEIERERIDVILTDIVMPGELDGLGLARSVSISHPRLPIVLATGYSDVSTEAAREFTILRKPFQLKELSRVLANARRTSGAIKNTLSNC